MEIEWPNGTYTIVQEGDEWVDIALEAGVVIPSGCLVGSCGACEIEINGEMVRACISSVPYVQSQAIKVVFAEDPFW